MHNFQETLEWYQTHQTARQIGFNPDGMCLKICRTARAIGSKYAAAVDAQRATPLNNRVTRVRDLRRGMVLYYDDPNDSNRFGHIVTMIGRVRGGNLDALSDILVETNSVKKGELVVVRGDYFPRYWGDKFQFGATWLNGVVLDVPSSQTKVQQFRRSGPDWNVRFLDEGVKAGRRELKSYVSKIEAAVEALPNDARNTRVMAFKKHFARHRVLKMSLLNDAVKGGREGAVMRSRDSIRKTIKSLPDK